MTEDGFLEIHVDIVLDEITIESETDSEGPA